MARNKDGQAAPEGLSLRMGIWISLCTVVGGSVGGYLGLEINIIAAAVGVLLGAFIGCSIGAMGPYLLAALGG